MHAQNISLIMCGLILNLDSDSVVFWYAFGGGSGLELFETLIQNVFCLTKYQLCGFLCLVVTSEFHIKKIFLLPNETNILPVYLFIFNVSSKGL